MNHSTSARANGPFVVINAAAITPERMEIELFGSEAAGAQGPDVAGVGSMIEGYIIRQEYGDILQIVRTWNFTRGGLETEAVDRP